MKYNVQLKVYEGPLDLLYDMISKQKIDIKDISIIDITKQYINYITALEKMDLEIASEFITMASKLLEIKSRYLLYKQKDNNEVEDPRLELMEKLEEYKKFKLASQDLKDNITYVDDLYYRKKEEIIIDDLPHWQRVHRAFPPRLRSAGIPPTVWMQWCSARFPPRSCARPGGPSHRLLSLIHI